MKPYQLLVSAFIALFCGNLFAAQNENPAEKNEGESRFSLEYELDAYYSNIGLYWCLTDAPIPQLGDKREFEIYRDLLLTSYIPRFVILEASFNPMPALGVFIKRNASDIYENLEFSDNFNLIKAVTAGFEEPYALSLFLGDVVSFTKPGQSTLVANKGYMGYLLSAGNYHIKDNEAIRDDWYELEWKIKGDRKNHQQSLHWSFKVGGKFHELKEISDVVYFSLKRSRVDYNVSAFSLKKNSGFEYTIELDKDNFNLVQQTFFISKKWPLKKLKAALSLDFGFILENNRKYSGDLKNINGDDDDLTVLLRPNIEF